LSSENYEKTHHNIVLIDRKTNDVFIGKKDLIEYFNNSSEAEMEVLRANIYIKKPEGSSLSDEEFMETYL